MRQNHISYFVRIILTQQLLVLLMPTAFGQKLFLVAGQSNAAGVGDSLLSHQCSPNSAFQYTMLYDSLLPLRDPVGENENGFEAAQTGSAWPAFAKRYYELSAQKVFIVPAARGGSSLNPLRSNQLRWDSLGNLWSTAVKKTKKAVKKTTVQLAGVIWAQGEADASFINANEFTKIFYKDQLKALIERFRFEFGPTLPFYIIQTGYAVGEKPGGYESIQNAQQEICEELPYTYLVYSFTKYFSEYNLMTDYIHYNQQGYNVLGKTIAEVIFEIEKTKTYTPPVYDDQTYPNPSNGPFVTQLINVTLEEHVKMEIYNMTGNIIKQFDLPLKREIIEIVEIDMSDLPDGIYILNTYLNEQRKIERIFVKH